MKEYKFFLFLRNVGTIPDYATYEEYLEWVGGQND